MHSVHYPCLTAIWSVVFQVLHFQSSRKIRGDSVAVNDSDVRVRHNRGVTRPPFKRRQPFLSLLSSLILFCPPLPSSTLPSSPLSLSLPSPPSLILSPCSSFPPSPLLSPVSPPLPLERGPLNPARVWGSAVSSPGGVGGGAPAEVEYLAAGGNNFIFIFLTTYRKLKI